jgi:uncharacterized protein YutE (UPF0331/DUF86 family)
MNREKLNIEILNESVEALTLSLQWLMQSVERCGSIVNKIDFTNPSDFEALEALTARFARTIDILTSKVYRGIDIVEMNKAKTFIAVIEYLEKTGVVTSFQQTKSLRELRNDIVHEYQQVDLNELFRSIYKSSHLLIIDVEKAIQYANKLVKNYKDLEKN